MKVISFSKKLYSFVVIQNEIQTHKNTIRIFTAMKTWNLLGKTKEYGKVIPLCHDRQVEIQLCVFLTVALVYVRDQLLSHTPAALPTWKNFWYWLDRRQVGWAQSQSDAAKSREISALAKNQISISHFLACHHTNWCVLFCRWQKTVLKEICSYESKGTVLRMFLCSTERAWREGCWNRGAADETVQPCSTNTQHSDWHWAESCSTSYTGQATQLLLYTELSVVCLFWKACYRLLPTVLQCFVSMELCYVLVILLNSSVKSVSKVKIFVW
jgi:hypothetical protein